MMAQNNLNEVIYAAWQRLFSDNDATAVTLALEEAGSLLAKDASARVEVGSNKPEIWPILQDLWSKTDLDRAESTPDLVVLSKFTRNLVAAVSENQDQAYAFEPFVSKFLFLSTAAAYQQDEAGRLASRVLTQTLSNMITGNDRLASQFLTKHLDTPENQNVLMRLLGCQDDGIVTSALVLLLNTINGSRARILAITTRPMGRRICVGILDQMSTLAQTEDSPDANRAFEIGYKIFTQFIEHNTIVTLYRDLFIHEETTTPHQTTILKIIDSYLQSSDGRATPEIIIFLFNQLLIFSDYAQTAIRISLGPRETPPLDVAPGGVAQTSSGLQELDLKLPKVCEALVLVLQGLITVTLNQERGLVDQELSELINDMVEHITFANKQGVVESVIELLRLLDVFLPRITFGKVVVPGHASNRTVDSSDFTFVKRDITRLVGILAHNTRHVQDRIRNCKGITVIMNMCVIDDQNPYIREHAIFALRNILSNNAENQAVVASIKPMGEWDEEGILRDTPGATRR